MDEGEESLRIYSFIRFSIVSELVFYASVSKHKLLNEIISMSYYGFQFKMKRSSKLMQTFAIHLIHRENFLMTPILWRPKIYTRR